jgi:predicted aspartyl protease
VALPTALTGQANQPKTIQFKLRDGYLMIVQAQVNGSGPFNFLLDTGTTRTVIDPELARQLDAPVVGEVSLTGALRRRQDKLVQLASVELDGASVSNFAAVVDRLTRQKILAPGIRGVIGEDFLSNFDFLVDYKRHWLSFGDPVPAGERCRFQRIGEYHGEPTTNRLLLPVEVIGVSRETFQLQLDSGAKVPELFPAGSEGTSTLPSGGTMATSSGANGTKIQSNVTLKVGGTQVRGMDLVQSRRTLAFDSAGLLPTSIFRRIYISHSGGFVILNPSE